MQYISMVAGRSKWTLANGDPMCPPPIKMSSFKRPVVSCTTSLKSDWVCGEPCKPHFSFNDLQDGSQTGWQTSRGRKGRIFVDRGGIRGNFVYIVPLVIFLPLRPKLLKSLQNEGIFTLITMKVLIYASNLIN